MAAGFETALDKTDEIQLTTTGRVTGRQTSRPVWFVRQQDKLYLVPVTGSDSQWYKNVVKTPAVGLAASNAASGGTATPVTDPRAVQGVLDDLRAKYGTQLVASYYPHPDVAVEVTLES
jgi:deazaflavin-dependent oxidoreductase (nitroreductase family)